MEWGLGEGQYLVNIAFYLILMWKGPFTEQILQIYLLYHQPLHSLSLRQRKEVLTVLDRGHECKRSFFSINTAEHNIYNTEGMQIWCIHT